MLNMSPDSLVSANRRIAKYSLALILIGLSFVCTGQYTRASDLKCTNMPHPQVLDESDLADGGMVAPAASIASSPVPAPPNGGAQDTPMSSNINPPADGPVPATQNIADILKDAELGDVAAQNDLAQRYLFGFGVEKDTVKAVDWYRKAAEQGDKHAQLQLGMCYTGFAGADKDPVQAVDWYRKAAEQGDGMAQYELGICYMIGRGVERDPVQAVAWFRKGAEQGNSLAMYYLGECYKDGSGVEKDRAQTVNWWYRKRAEQGDKDAQLKMGMCYSSGDGVEKDPVQAVVWYRKAAEQGLSSAQYNLAVSYETGLGVEMDPVQAVTWYRKAAEQGCKEAQNNLGMCYQSGEGIEKDLVQAVAWFRKAAEQGEYAAHGNLGRCFRDGMGVVQDDRQACVHFLIAGGLGHPGAYKEINILRNERLSETGYNDAQRRANAWMEEFQSRSKNGIVQSDESKTAQQVEKLPSTGSGFVISTDGYFLTCAHVVEGYQDIMVRLGAKTFPAKLVRADAHNDVALLKLDGTDFQPLALSQSLPEMGDKVFTVGFPNPDLQGASAKYTDGAISSLTGIMDDIRTMQITVPIQGGNSGGPLVDESGNALGLVVAQMNAAAVFEYTGTIPQNVNFAIKIGYALPLVQSVPDLARNLPQPRMANPDARPVDEVQAATGLVLVYE